MKQFLKKYYQYIITGAVITLVMIILYALKHYWPFGDASIMYGDYLSQTTPFFVELKSMIQEGQSVFHTWRLGFGSDFWSVIYFGHINPMTVFFMIVPMEYWLQLGQIVYIVTLIAMSWTMLAFLRHRPFAKLEKENPANILFSLAYAFCAYTIAYANIWYFMVCAIFFPLILLGLERMVAGKGWKMYCIMLAVAFISNYYFAGLFCLFIIFYYLTLEFGSLKEFLQMSLKTLVVSLVAIGVSAGLFLPVALQMVGHSYTFSEVSDQVFFGSFFDIIKQFFSFNIGIGMGEDAHDYSSVNLYYGLLCLLLTTLYFFVGKTKLHVRLRKLAVWILYFLAFNTGVLNYMMHMFHYPTFYPNRFALFFSLFCIVLAYEAWVTIVESEYKELKITKVVPVSIAWVILTVVTFAFATKIDYQFTYYYSMMAFLFYMVMMLLLPYVKKLSVVLVSVACVGICINTLISGIFRDDIVSWSNMLATQQRTRDFVSDKDMPEAHGFSRSLIEKDLFLGSNTGLFEREKNPTIFTSTVGNSNAFLNSFGISGTGNTLSNYTYTPATMSIFNIEYILRDNVLDYWDGDREIYSSSTDIYTEYETIYEDDTYTVMHNDQVLSLGYMVPFEAADRLVRYSGAVKEDDFIFGDSINDLVRSFGGEEDVMVAPPVTYLGIKGDNCYAAYDGKKIFLSIYDTENVRILFGDDTYMSHDLTMKQEDYIPTEPCVIRMAFEAEEPGCYYFEAFDVLAATGYMEKGEQFIAYFTVQPDEIASMEWGYEELQIYYFDDAAWNRAYETLSKQQLEVSHYDNTHVEGTIDAAEDGIMFTSISYNDAWHAYVDGEEVEVCNLWNDAFLGVPMPAGKHEVKLVYRPKGLGMGLAVSASCILLFLLLMLRWKQTSSDKETSEELPEKATEEVPEETTEEASKETPKEAQAES